VSITVATNDVRGLTKSSVARMDPSEPADIPEFFAPVDGGRVMLHPKPRVLVPMTVAVSIAPKANATTVDTLLVEKWGHVLREGALANLFNIIKMPWTDLNLADRADRKFQQGVNNAAAAAAARYKVFNQPIT
jgi:hypothetical protein